MSEVAINFSAISCPSGVEMSSVTDILLRFTPTKYALSFVPGMNGGAKPRVSSPAPGRSILMTSAPRSPSIWAQVGPARTRVRSNTRRPFSGPVVSVIRFSSLPVAQCGVYPTIGTHHLETRRHEQHGRLRLHHRGRGIGGLRARQSPYRGHRRDGPAARSRRPRPPPLHSNPPRTGQTLATAHVRLGLRYGTGTTFEQPPHPGAAWQSTGRQFLG